MQNWLVSLLTAFVLSTAASAEKFTLEVVDLDNARSCYEGYSLQVSGVPEGTKYIEFDLAWECGTHFGSFEAAIESDGVLNLADYALNRTGQRCNFPRFKWTARAKPKSGWVPKSLAIARLSFDNASWQPFSDGHISVSGFSKRCAKQNLLPDN